MTGPTVTRFNPTVNGPLHLGHLYMILVNEHEAHHTPGGRFILRFDDNQLYWQRRLTSDQIGDYCNEITDQLDWLGIPVDDWIYQSWIQEETERELLWRNRGPLPVAAMEEGQRLIYDRALGANPYPYIPVLTAEKVLMDFRSGVTHLIRGQDLLSEYCLYEYFCELWHLPFVYHTYLPRLRRSSDHESVSKTEGGYSIAEFQNGYTAQDLLALLSRWCKIDPEGPWAIANIKPQPTICEHDL